MQVVLERLHLGQALEQPSPCLRLRRLAVRARLDVLAQPDPLLVVRDVLDLVGDRAGVGLAQLRERVGEGLAGHGHSEDRSRDAAHQLVVEAHGGGLERGVADRLGSERVEARGEVAVHALCLHQRGGRLDRLEQRRVHTGFSRRGGGGRNRLRGRDRRRSWRALGARGHAHGREDGVVEAVLALQQLVDAAQERAGLRTLDDAVVVGRGHRHDLLDAELGQPSRVDRGESGRVADGARGHDRALAGHQPRHARDGADAAGVRERDVGALVGVGLKRVVARAHHQLVVARHEVGEAELARVAQNRHHERARAVLALHVHGEPEADAPGGHALRLPVLLGVGVAHHGHVAGGLHDRPGDQVRERQLLAGRLQLLATAVERVHRHGAEARGRGDRAALVHELHERGRGAADGLDVGAGRCRGRGAAITLDGG